MCGLCGTGTCATRSNHTFCTTCLPIAHQHQGLQPHPFQCGSPMAPVLLSINMRCAAPAGVATRTASDLIRRRNCSQFTPAGRAAARLAYNTVRARHGTVARAHRSPQPVGTSCEPRFELRTCPRHASPRTHRAACESRGMHSRSSSAWEHRLRAAVVPAPAWARRRST